MGSKRTRIALILLAVIVATMGGTVGCERESSAPKPKIKATWSPTARYDPYQQTCPVCGKGIKQGQYVDVETKEGKKRLFFDSEECIEKFNESPEKYLNKYKAFRQRAEEARGESPFGEQQQVP